MPERMLVPGRRTARYTATVIMADTTIPVEATRVCVARADAIAEGVPHSVSANGVDLVLIRTRDGLRAFQGRCPHQGALLGEGEIDGNELVCRNHRWRFDTNDGHRVGGVECLMGFPVIEQGGDVLVDVPEGVEGTAQPSRRRTIADLTGPTGWPLVGNLFQLDLPRLHEVLEGWAIEYGPLYRYRMGPQYVVVVTNPDLTDQILRARPETYRRLGNVEPVFREMGVSGVFSAEGAAWRSQRRLAMEALSPRHLRGFYPRLRTVASRLLGRWERQAHLDRPLDIVDDLKRFTVDITTLLTFGYDVNTLEQQGDDVIQRRLEHVFPAFNRRLFALFPTWRLIRSPADHRLDRALTEIRAWLQRLVEDARVRLENEPGRAAQPSDFLEAMLSARDEAGRPFSDDVLYGNLMTMLLAGEDTTAYTLGWAVHELCGSPSSVSALQSELASVMGSSQVPDDFDSAQRLTYAGAVANETMRLRPVAPLLFLQTNVATMVGDLHVPADTPVAVLTRPPAVDAQNFERPTAFLPERWTAPSGAHEPSAHIPFGSGPRLCPGRTLALLEMKVVLATLYRNFDVEREGSATDVREQFSFTMSPVGLWVRLRRRAQGDQGDRGEN
jgi:cytochrome P450/nitrite reductase/ring-hydroxylating ferredoxin subunit